MSKTYAIVLGAAVWPSGVPSPTLRRRAEKAGQLFFAGGIDGIVACGGLGVNPPSEAEVIRDLLCAQGVSEHDIILENRSRTTYENLAYAKALIPSGAHAVIVSDRWHLPRARLAARRLGLAATGAPASTSGTHPARVLRAILREIPAYLWYLVRRGRYADPSSKR